MRLFLILRYSRTEILVFVKFRPLDHRPVHRAVGQYFKWWSKAFVSTTHRPPIDHRKSIANTCLRCKPKFLLFPVCFTLADKNYYAILQKPLSNIGYNLYQTLYNTFIKRWIALLSNVEKTFVKRLKTLLPNVWKHFCQTLGNTFAKGWTILLPKVW